MADLWSKKMETYFKRVDFDGDGVITKKDFEGMAERFIKQGELTGDTAKHLTEKTTELWEAYHSSSGGVDSIDKATFVKAMDKIAHDHISKITEAPFKLFFGIVDANNDGMIQGSEFEDFFRIMGLDPKLAAESFKAIDTNNDNLLSLDEFISAGVEFFTSREDTPTKLFFGPLE